MRVRSLTLLLVSAVAAVAASPAEGASVSHQEQSSGVIVGVFVGGEPGEANEIVVRRVPGEQRLEIRDTGAELSVAEDATGCEKTGTGTGAVVRCDFDTPETPIADVQPDDRDDEVTLDSSGGPVALVASGGAGRDTLRGGDRDDVLFGDAGDDELSGGDGRDTIAGSEGADALRGGAGSLDLLYGGPDDDSLDGEEGNDSLDGGNGADAMTDTGEEGRDGVTYFFETTDAAGVDVSLDGEANDGNAALDAGATDNVGAGIENVQGSQYGDDLYGGPGDDFLSGQGGDDLLVGRGGADAFDGATGNDVVDARDDGRDEDIDCDSSTGVLGDGDRALLDAADPEPRNCETVERAAPPEEPKPDEPKPDEPKPDEPKPGEPKPGEPKPQEPKPQEPGPEGPKPPVQPPNGKPPVKPAPPSGLQPGQPGVLCVPAPARRCVKATDSYGRIVFPDLTGLSATEVSWALAKLGVQVRTASADVKRDRRRRDRLPKHPDGDRWKEGMVTAQTVARGTRVTTGSNITVPLDLTLWEGPDRETCTQTSKELAGLDLVEWERMMGEYGCKLDDVLVKLRDSTRKQKEVDLNSGDRCEVVRARRSSGKKVDATIAAPDDPKLTDLRLGFKETYLGPSFIASDSDAEAWTLPVTDGAEPAAMVVTVQDRTGALIDGVDVYLDATGAGGAAIDGETGFFAGSGAGDRGTRAFRFKTPETGRVRLVAVASDRNGNSLCGTAEVKVTDPGKRYTTLSGNEWKRDREGTWQRVAAKASRVEARAASLGFILEQASRLRYFFGLAPRAEVGPVAKELTTNPDKRAAVREVFKTHGATLMQVSCGEPLSGKAANAQTEAVPSGLVATDGRQSAPAGGRVVTCAGGNKVFGVDEDNDILADPSKLLGKDVTTLVGPDGASLVGPDGASLVGPDGASLIGMDGASLIGMDGASLVGPDGASLVGPDGASLVGPDGASLVGPDAASLIGMDGASVKDMDRAGIISTNAGGLVGNNGNTAVAVGGAGLVAAPGGNLVARGAG